MIHRCFRSTRDRLFQAERIAPSSYFVVRVFDKEKVVADNVRREVDSCLRNCRGDKPLPPAWISWDDPRYRRTSSTSLGRIEINATCQRGREGLRDLTSYLKSIGPEGELVDIVLRVYDSYFGPPLDCGEACQERCRSW